MTWILEFALAAGLALLLIPPAVWLVTVLLPFALLLPALGISRYADPRGNDPGRAGAERGGKSRIRRQERKDS